MRKRTTVCIVIVLLAGCTGIRPGGGPPNEAAWQQRRMFLETLQRWSLEGRVGIAVGDKGTSASLTWHQQQQTLNVAVSGPFGVGGAHITGNGDVLKVRTSNGKTFLATDPVRDLQLRLGWTLPVGSMRYWMLGLPAPGTEYQKQVDNQGRLVTLTQQGWRVVYSEYGVTMLNGSAGPELPTRLTVTRAEVRIKLAISDWRLPGDAQQQKRIHARSGG